MFLTLYLVIATLLHLSCPAFSISAPDFQSGSNEAHLVNCLTRKNVPTAYNTSVQWLELAKSFNVAQVYNPVAITLPTTTQEVSDSVSCAASIGIKVQARSGGHSYASYSTGGKNGSLIVDLRMFHTISVNDIFGSNIVSATGVASVGGGVRLGNLDLSLYAQGKRALPHGTCPDVGIGGHFTHGGYGYVSRAWGLAMDTIIGLDVVLANGSLIHASASTYPDIYFALRGAADSFGIITTFYLQTLAAPKKIVVFSVSMPAVLKSSSEAAHGFLRLQEFALTSPHMTRNLTFGIVIEGGKEFTLKGWYLGYESYFRNTMLPVITETFPGPFEATISSRTWLESLANETDKPLEQPLTDYRDHGLFYAKSIVTREAYPLTFKALMSFFGFIIAECNASCPTNWRSIINLYGGRDSQINAVPTFASGYSGRNDLWVIQNFFSLEGQNRSKVIDFASKLTRTIPEAQPEGQFGASLSYVDPMLSWQEAAVLYYGPELYHWLAALKRKVDPRAVFWNPQAVHAVDIYGVPLEG
ncbi:uncharacterized protein N7482_001305 [Penicillium canariense]|uniref:FAD-binding PCMH-type domain-containing protein n=1 Tax=Penicillium canariense TaxID=189055 RepID=A0A9W9LST8_9EURO|nr:uncharacterized protein N7482_001305 [Penicillium canariense]KAJ5175428.1 hypothetical protein N7482_001305 [Penicillium canariense]